MLLVLFPAGGFVEFDEPLAASANCEFFVYSYKVFKTSYIVVVFYNKAWMCLGSKQ